MEVLSDRVAIVTGGASGIGAAISDRFAREGARVVIADVDLENAKSRAHQIQGRTKTARTTPYHLDVSDPAEVEAMTKSVLKEFGSIDILVNSAGIFNFVSTDKITPELWKRLLDVDLNGTFYCCLYVGREMIKRSAGKSLTCLRWRGWSESRTLSRTSHPNTASWG